MSNDNQRLKVVDLKEIDERNYQRQFTGCLILTKDNAILLQQRGEDWNSFPGYLSEFGGAIEANETPSAALLRELQEELGAEVHMNNVLPLGVISEEATNHAELGHMYFWSDREGLITGCYEGEARHYANSEDVLRHPKVMDSVKWLLVECKKRQLIK